MLDSEQTPGIPTERPDGTKARHYISQHQLGLLLKLHQDNRTQVEIAQILRVHQATVSKALKRLGADTTGLASHHLRTKAYNSARRVSAIAEKGKDADAIKAAKLVLEGSGVISTTSTVQLGVQVLIGGEAKPAIQASSITVDVGPNEG